MEQARLIKEGKLAYLTVNNPPVNALNYEVLDALEQAVDELAKDEEVLVVILSGEGDKAFVAGADISEFPKLGREDGEKVSGKGQEIFQKLSRLPQVVISAVHGFALGGGLELAASADIRILSKDARLGVPEVTLGVLPGYGGTQLLPRLLPEGKAKELIFTGSMIEAEEAYRLGLGDYLVESGELMDKAKEVAKKIAKNGPLAVKAAKKAVNEGRDKPLDEGLKLEATKFGELCTTEDKNEGANAFLEKRKPEFKGK